MIEVKKMVKQVGIDIVKIVKSIARETFKDVNVSTRVKPSKKKYTRKEKYKGGVE